MEKKIHYCWFGKGKKTKMFKICYNSWKKYFPDYEIIEWNENNFDINCNKYVEEAYELKKYAFVSDYARLKAIYEHGGIYFDTDVEVIRPIDKKIIENGFFAEEAEGKLSTGLGFSTNKNEKILKQMLDDYENIHFVNDGKIDMTPCTIRNTNSLISRGYELGAFKKINGITIYPISFFGGWDLKNDCIDVSENTYTIHHYNGSWLSNKDKIYTILKRKFIRVIGKKNAKKIRKIIKKV